MQKLVVAHINPYMREGTAHGVEEHQVTRLEVFRTDLVAHLRHLGRRSWQIEPQRIPEDLAHQPTTIESTALRTVTAEKVLDAEIGESLVEQLTHTSLISIGR